MDDVTGNLFSLFCSTWRSALKMVVRLYRIKQVKASKTFRRRYLLEIRVAQNLAQLGGWGEAHKMSGMEGGRELE